MRWLQCSLYGKTVCWIQAQRERGPIFLANFAATDLPDEDGEAAHVRNLNHHMMLKRIVGMFPQFDPDPKTPTRSVEDEDIDDEMAHGENEASYCQPTRPPIHLHGREATSQPLLGQRLANITANEPLETSRHGPR